MISFTGLYLLFVIASILLFNALILMARYVQQTKRPPTEADYDELEHQARELNKMIQNQNQEISGLQRRMKELEEEAATAAGGEDGEEVSPPTEGEEGAVATEEDA